MAISFTPHLFERAESPVPLTGTHRCLLVLAKFYLQPCLVHRGSTFFGVALPSMWPTRGAMMYPPSLHHWPIPGRSLVLSNPIPPLLTVSIAVSTTYGMGSQLTVAKKVQHSQVELPATPPCVQQLPHQAGSQSASSTLNLQQS
jgi:hypothetical protein